MVYTPEGDELTFSVDMTGYPTKNSPIVRDEEHVLVYAHRSRNADGDYEIRSYQVLGDKVSIKVDTRKQADLAATLVDVFTGDPLVVQTEYNQQSPVRKGVPVAVAVDGKPAIAAWLEVKGWDRDRIADEMDVSRSTIREYLSRFRSRGTGIPDDVDAPEVGEIVPELPPEFDPTVEKVGYVEYACGHEHVGGEPFDGPLLCPQCGGERVSASATYAPVDGEGGEA